MPLDDPPLSRLLPREFEQILCGVPEPILAQRPGGTLVFANEAAARLLGFASPRAVLECPDPLLALADVFDVHGKAVLRAEWPDKRALAGEKPDELLVRCRLQGDRSERWLLVKSTPAFEGAGEVQLAITVLRDVTAVRHVEEQLRHAQKLEALGRLASGIAHDFNNMLMAITGYSEVALERLPASHPVRPLLQEIRQSGERAAALTGQLLAYSRKQVLAPRVFQLNAVVVELQRMLARLLGPEVMLRCELDPDLGLVHADISQIEQVVVNLAVNARDAMKTGGLMMIRTANVEIAAADADRAAGLAPGRYVELEVRDTGHGMDSETRARIFEPFFTTKAQGKGTGLGLATVEGVVKQSGGCVLVESQPGQGATFRIRFPRVDGLAAPAGGAGVSGRPRNRPISAPNSIA